jgi:hypothetical protein
MPQCLNRFHLPTFARQSAKRRPRRVPVAEQALKGRVPKAYLTWSADKTGRMAGGLLEAAPESSEQAEFMNREAGWFLQRVRVGELIRLFPSPCINSGRLKRCPRQTMLASVITSSYM